jgi:hypothetical protein
MHLLVCDNKLLINVQGFCTILNSDHILVLLCTNKTANVRLT